MNDLLEKTENKTLNKITALNVHQTLEKKMLVDGYDIVLDIERSKGTRLIDAKTGNEYLDMFSFFGSSPIGINHPKLKDEDFVNKIGKIAAANKPSNSDVYTVEMAQFVDTFSEVAVPANFKYLFFIDGGALAVENGLKVAFDWKVKKNFKKGYKEEKGTKIIHFKEAFHGRSGYTLSLTNTDPNKVNYFPKFDWPRVTNPKIKFPLDENYTEIISLEAKAINEIQNAIDQNPDDIAAIIIEPIQAEGGDNFFRKEFFEKLRQIADENDILLMFDEVQTGLGLTGKMWAFQHYVQPDIIAFGKKMQVCGIMVTDRIDDIEDHSFRKSSRINSTWGGNLVDMIRSQRNLEIIAEDNLIDNAKKLGEYLLDELKKLENEFPQLISSARGLGLMCSFDMPSKDVRNSFINLAYKEKLLILPCGPVSIRFRPVLDVKIEDIDLALKKIKNVLSLLR